MESIAVAEKIRDMTVGIKKNLQSVLNKIGSKDISSELKAMLKDKSIKIAGVIPYDPAVFESGFKGHAMAHGTAFQAAEQILKALLPLTTE